MSFIWDKISFDKKIYSQIFETKFENLKRQFLLMSDTYLIYLFNSASILLSVKLGVINLN